MTVGSSSVRRGSACLAVVLSGARVQMGLVPALLKWRVVLVCSALRACTAPTVRFVVLKILAQGTAAATRFPGAASATPATLQETVPYSRAMAAPATTIVASAGSV